MRHLSRRSSHRHPLLRSLATMALIATALVTGASTAQAVPGASSTVFINEFHYDNTGDDVGEFVEVAGPAGTDLAGWSLVLYNGNGGGAYNTIALSGVLADQSGGYGFVSVDAPGLQNGSPDGIALVNAATVVQFLSYEGSFTAADGPAAGMTSADVGVSEPFDTPIGQSLQLTGTGTTAADFTWTGPAAASLDAVNAGQTFGVEPPAPRVVVNEVDYDQPATDAAEFVELYNAGPGSVDLTDWSLELVNGNGGATYATIALSGSLAAGEFLVVCANAATVANCDIDASPDTNFIQNGAPDAIALRDGGGAIADAVSYEGSVPGVVEGSGTGLEDDANAGARSISRLPDGTDTDQNNVDFVLACSTPGEANAGIETGCGDTVFVHDIQGTGSVSPLVGREVTVEALVTALFERDDVLDGFFVQEEDADADLDAATSEGIFVFCRNNCPSLLAAGDLVEIEGTVSEFFGMSQIDIAFGNGTATIVNSGNPLPAPTAITLPAPGSTVEETTFESTEGMLVTFPDTLVVSEYFQLARFGQIVLTEGSRPYQFTDDNAPSATGYADFLADLATRRIILDDDNNDNNDAISDGPDEAYYYPGGGLSTGNRFRGGDTITDLTGVMHWSFAGSSGTDAWRIRPIPSEYDYSFEPVNEAPASPDEVGGRITAAAFNVLNLFSTIDTTSSNSAGSCGPTGDQDCRGADSAAELARQQAKIVAALAEMDADVVGLIELENDGDDRSIADLVALLNAATAPDTYDFVATGFIGSDAIKVGLIYQPASVTPVGGYEVLDSAVDPRFIDTKNRPMLVQTFEENLTGSRFTAAVNHLKSKGSGCDDVGDPNLNDGQGSCPMTRANAAAAIADFLADEENVLILGDLNSYASEDAITVLEDAGYTDLLEAFVGDDAYTYVFDGQLGYLDYALAGESLLGQITGATAWHINADEIPIFDYNDDVRDDGEASFERESGVLPVYDPDPLRSSDHDPVVVGLELDIDPTTATGVALSLVDGLEADGVINGGQANALGRRLEQALRQYDRGRIGSAVDILTGVLDQLDEFVADGVLTAEEAAPLATVVTLLLETIG